MEPIDGDRGPKANDIDVSYINSRVPLNIAWLVLDVVEVHVPSWELPADIDKGVGEICGRRSS